MKPAPLPAALLPLLALTLPGCHEHAGHEEHTEHHKIVATTPLVKEVTVTQRYVCQIRSRQSIEVRALQEGYLEPITLREGQTVNEKDVLFKVNPTLYKKRLDAELAEVRQAELELEFTKNLAGGPKPVVSQNEVLVQEAKLAKAKAKAETAQAELDFTVVKAPFGGIIDRLNQQTGSLVKKEEVLTTLSDNHTMWVYFNVPEVRYLEYKGRQGATLEDPSRLKLVDSTVDLVLADGSTFNQTPGDTVTMEGKFNNETGTIQFRADFPNPDKLLRSGQTGNLLIHRKVAKAMVIPQRATYELLDKRYVYVLEKDGHVHHREIDIQYEQEDVFVLKEKETDGHGHVKKGLDETDRIVLEGGNTSLDGAHVAEFEFRKPEDAIANQKQPAE